MNNIENFEINLWRQWKRNDANEVYSFIPAKYNVVNFEDFKMGIVTDSKLQSLQIPYRVFSDNTRVMLQIAIDVFQIKQIDGSKRPATMVLVDELNNEIAFTEKTVREDSNFLGSFYHCFTLRQ